MTGTYFRPKMTGIGSVTLPSIAVLLFQVVRVSIENLYFTISMVARQTNHKIYKNKAYSLTKT